MTSWNDLPQHVRDTATRVLTPKELDAWKLSLGGAGYRRIGLALGIAPETARKRLTTARLKMQHTIDKGAHPVTTIPFDTDTGQLIVPIRITPNAWPALQAGVDVTRIQIVPSDQGDYTLSLTPTDQQPEPTPPAKPNRAQRRTRSKAA
jgi:DNA-binding CsgD family transcriptional regulator